MRVSIGRGWPRRWRWLFAASLVLLACSRGPTEYERRRDTTTVVMSVRFGLSLAALDGDCVPTSLRDLLRLRPGVQPIDAWGRSVELVYVPGRGVRVVSLGKDGQRGTADDITSFYSCGLCELPVCAGDP